MKLIVMAAASAALALSLSGCVSPGAIGGAPTVGKGLTGEQILAAQKEYNRHIELCDRTLAWPFAVMIHCAPASAAALTAADVQAMLAKGFADLKAQLAAPPTN